MKNSMENEETSQELLISIANTSDLSTAILRLEARRLAQENDLKVHAEELFENLKPANILKNTIHEVQQSVPLKNNLLKIAVGLGAGYFSRKMVIGKSAGIVKKLLGAALQFGVTSIVAKKNVDDDIQEFGPPKKKNLFRRILSI